MAVGVEIAGERGKGLTNQKKQEFDDRVEYDVGNLLDERESGELPDA